MMTPIALFALAFVPMLLEAQLAASNERALRRAGAVEPRDDVYSVMRFAYPLSFVAMILEASLRNPAPRLVLAVGLVVFVAAKALKYWAVAALGTRWTFRVLVVPASPLVSRGPYRFLRHPNYVAVIGELGGMALLAAAPVAGACAVVAFSLIILARIAVEERALGLRPSLLPHRTVR